MANIFLAALVVRLLLPASLLFSISLRPFGISVIYLLLYLIAPHIQTPDRESIKGGPGRYTFLTMVISNVLLFMHVVWHSVLAAYAPYGSLLNHQRILQKIGENLGLVSYNGVNTLVAVQYLAPELIMATMSIIIHLTVKKLCSTTSPDGEKGPHPQHRQFPLLTSAGKYLCLLLIMAAGIMYPSVTSGIYFLAFMGAATAWSLGQPLERGFAVVSRCLMAIMAVHLLVLIAYQCVWINEFYPPDMPFSRYFGFTKLVNLTVVEGEPASFKFENTDDYSWPILASPLVILITYYVLGLEARELLKPKLLRSHTSKHWSSERSRLALRRLHQDSVGSVYVSPDTESYIEPEEPTLMDDLIAAVVDFFEVLVRSSYIATTIIMMAWSIMFHSWLAFVFLMWANVVWLCQDQRSFMLRTSPLLVLYAMFLLLVQYVYSMDLLETELPSTSQNVNLQQIGMGREPGAPCVSLLIKSLFTCMFWVTLRQLADDAARRRHAAAPPRDLAAPLPLPLANIPSEREYEKRSRLLRYLGDFLKAMCARYWIYVVVIMLCVIGITGERMTIFRIVYMFLFLGFIIMFQISWYWWRRLMYVFWITVIIYSMINLILLYIYQFDNFSNLIQEYLKIDSQLQHDLGLEPFKKADLFIKLLTPTCFLIITILQVHYFHKDFMALSHPRTRQSSFAGNSTADNASSKPSQGGASTMKDDVPPLPSDGEQPAQRKDHFATEDSLEVSTYRSKQDLTRKSSRERSYLPTLKDSQSDKRIPMWFKKRLMAFKSLVLGAVDKIFVYLHLHLIKILFFALTLLCAMNVCAMHVPIMLLVTTGLLMSAKHQRCVLMFISILISIYLMMKMIYQIEYIRPSKFDVNCTMSDSNTTETRIVTFNNAEWLGLTKVSSTLPSLLRGYIGLIALFTFHSLVMYRQKSISHTQMKFEDLMLFPEVTRKDADIDLVHCAKYLINYGFYKFGVELTLICLIGVIGSRMDLYAVFYSFWLLLLVGVKREVQAKFWPAFTGCITFFIPIQYIIAVGLTPQLCVQYSWSGRDSINTSFRTWLFLPDPESPPHASKIVFDFVLLLFATRQLRVFRIERKHGVAYAGGCNSEDIGDDWETPSFVNPVPDFLGVISTWLDLIKRLVFLVMLWVTLAIMFLTGTNRVNFFSMGYLIGSFIFLWQGTDFYLRPKHSILQWWSWLLGYNVTVVFVKTLLQIPGCLYAPEMRIHACWLVQLLGIGCVDKFAGGNVSQFIKMHPSSYTDAQCSVPQEDIGLAWDGVCFAFLILQKRLFRSYYFYRVIDESKATTVLASRGAELIEELRVKQMMLQEEQEVKILEKIKVKMERIKANQKKVQGAVSKEPPHHDFGIGSGSPPLSKQRVYTKRHEARDRPYKQPTSHQKAVRSGDYYMFDEFDDTEIPLKDHESSSDEDVPKEMGFGKLLSTAIKTDLRRAVSLRRSSMSSARARTLSAGTYTYSEQRERRRSTKISPSGTDAHHIDHDSSNRSSYAQAEETCLDNLLHYWHTTLAFVSSVLVTLTKYLMRFSRDYRYVSRALSMEKRILKEQEGFGIGLRVGSQMIWEPLPEVRENIKDLTILEEQEDSMFKHDRNPFVHLTYALFYAVVAHTDIVCFIMVFINQIQSATILSIPLPLMVFLWGTLTIPRPTKTFWVTLIAYTEVIVLLKSMFQFEILPWNQIPIPENMPFTAPRIIGIERKANYALYDLLLLLIIFLHRFMLKSLGLWKESSIESDLRKDDEFNLAEEDTQMLVEGKLEEVGKKFLKLHDEIGPNEERLQVEKRPSGLAGEPQPGPSNAPGDDHYKVNDDQEPIIAVTTSLEDKYGNLHRVLLLGVRRYLRPTKEFFMRMLVPGARVTADVYAYMFLCDFFNFLVIIFGFAAFGTHQGDGGVQAYLEENKVPIPFLVMLILQFILIIVDRALYLRKYILGKILFQYALIIGVHIWMFFVLPSITERTFNSRLPPPIWYMVKCLYLLLSAHQIRCGYPRRIIGNFLCKSYRFLNMVFFRCFMAVPFVFELRTLMDWIWTDTSMNLMDWLKMEDIFASVFLLKCSRYIEDEYPQPRGATKSKSTKYILGGSVLAFIIAIIWFPLVFFAFGDSVGQPNPPTDVTVKIRIGPFLPVYQMSAQSHNIEVFSAQDYTQLSNQYSRDRTAQTFLSNYMYNDVAVVVINPNSTMKWEISPPELDRLVRETASNGSLLIRFTFVITRPSNNAQNPPTIDDHREMPLVAFVNGTRNPERETLLRLLTGNASSDTWLNVQQLFPKFLKVFNKGIAKPAYQLIPESITEDETSRLYRNVQLRLERDSAGVMYWRVRESCTDRDTLLLSIPKNTCDMLVMYTFNDKLFPETLNFISGGGIIGLYTTFVFLASRVLRGFFSGIYTKIMFDDLPNVDRVLQLCLDIYLVREALEMALEEDLFSKLVFLYRSPETMIKWTRPKDEEEPPALPAVDNGE